MPARSHAAEASYVSASALCLFRASIVRALLVHLAILNLLDGPVGVDPAFSYCLDQVSFDAQVLGISAAGDSSCLSDAGFDCSWSS